MNYFSKNRWWSIALIVLFAANIITLLLFWLVKAGPVAPAVPPPPAAESRGPKNYIIKELNLSASQQDQYARLFKEHQQKVRALRDSIRVSKDAFFALLNNDNIPANELNEAAARSSRYQQQLDILTFNHFKDVKAICTPEQQKQFNKVIQIAIKRMGPPPPPPAPPLAPPPGTE